MGEGYRSGQVGYVSGRALVSRAAARGDLLTKLRKYDGPFVGSPAHPKDWGPEKTRDDIVQSAFKYVDSDPLGRRFKVRPAKYPDAPTFVLQRAFDIDGSEVISAGLSQLGVRYVFADIDPRGPQGGPGAGFDCSGLVVWCYQQVGYDLPHSSEAIRLDSRLVRFQDQGRCQPGDPVIMWFPNSRGIPAGHASHIGMWVRPGMMLDTRNPYDEPVAIRPIETGSVLCYGRYPKVNGRLAG